MSRPVSTPLLRQVMPGSFMDRRRHRAQRSRPHQHRRAHGCASRAATSSGRARQTPPGRWCGSRCARHVRHPCGGTGLPVLRESVVAFTAAPESVLRAADDRWADSGCRLAACTCPAGVSRPATRHDAAPPTTHPHDDRARRRGCRRRSPAAAAASPLTGRRYAVPGGAPSPPTVDWEHRGRTRLGLQTS